MKNEIKNYIDLFIGKREYFIFLKFYKNPNEIIDNKNYLFNNENFITFLSILIYNDDFLKKLDTNIINKLLMLNLNGEIERKLILEKKIIYTLKDKKEYQKLDALISIKTYDFDNIENCFLYKNNLYNNYLLIVDTLFCNNDFIYVINNKLDLINNKTIISNIIDIIEGSIQVKNRSTYNDWIYSRLDNDYIQKYNLKDANNLLKKLYKKLNEKHLKLVKTEN